MDPSRREHYQAIVDMGSNGIRFSITDLAPPTTRILPTLYQSRTGISLYDAQWPTGASTKQPIPEEVIQAVIRSYQSFKSVCDDFGVPAANIRVLATEATREAINSADFRKAIKDNTGWDVEILPKEEEGRVGAYGVASSFTDVKGLVMDLGGGSTQLTWLSVNQGSIDIGKGSISLPYGAAALSQRLAKAQKEGEKGVATLRQEMESRLSEAYEKVQPTPKPSNISLFLSGGGFRGWGYLLMDTHQISPYPIPIINGFSVSPKAFLETDHVKAHAAEEDDIFRVSERRASQVPAVAFLVQAVSRILPEIQNVRFCQGGVREGALFASLPKEVREVSPLTAATWPYTPPSSLDVLQLIQSGVAKDTPNEISAVLPAFANLLYTHSSLPKESRAAAALRCTTSGILTGVHGLSHDERMMLALVLCERWGGDISKADEEFFARLQRLCSPAHSWWARYLGRTGAVISQVYPAGVVGTPRIEMHVETTPSLVKLRITFRDLATKDNDSVQKAIEHVEKLGKKKNWIGGADGWGMKVNVEQR